MRDHKDGKCLNTQPCWASWAVGIIFIGPLGKEKRAIIGAKRSSNPEAEERRGTI